MTKTNMDPSELLAKHDQGDFLRGIAEAVLQLIMESDVDGLIGAGRHERTPWRNGYRERSLDTRLGTLNLRVPKLRQGSYFPGFLEARKTSEQALVAVIQEAWIGGVSTRRVDEPVQAMGLSGISKSTVSKPCKDLDEKGRRIPEPAPDRRMALSLARRHLPEGPPGREDRARRRHNRRGRQHRGPPGNHRLGVGPSEAETSWTEFLRALKARGLGGVRLVISPRRQNGPLDRFVPRLDPYRPQGRHRTGVRSDWQGCRVRWTGNALAHVSRGRHTVIAAAIRQAFDQPDRTHAGETWRKVAEQLRPRWPKLATLMDDAEHDVLAYMSFPRQHRTKLHSTDEIDKTFAPLCCYSFIVRSTSWRSVACRLEASPGSLFSPCRFEAVAHRLPVPRGRDFRAETNCS